jgi:DNA replication protein DnaC
MRVKRDSISCEALSQNGIPKEFHNLTIKDFQTFNEPVLQGIKDFLDDYLSTINYNFERNKGFLLSGTNGVGKTMISCLVLKEAYVYRYSIRRVTFVEYINRYTAAWNCNNFEERKSLEDLLFKNFKSVEFLCLEEIGKEIESKIGASVLEDLLRFREDKSLPTILCTNLTKNMIKQRYGSSVVSLIDGNMIHLSITGEDRRKEFAFKMWGI